MPTVDLPAHNVYPESASATTSDPVITGGPECLASTDTATGVALSAQTESFFVGGAEGASSSGQSLGFGLWEQPAGSTITDIRFVAHGYREGGGAIPDGTYDTSQTNTPTEFYPMLTLHYQGAPYSRGYNISTIPETTYGEALCGVRLTHFIDGADYVIAGIGEPDTGTFGLCPVVRIDNFYPWPAPDITVHLSYLAIRITYRFAGPTTAPPRRLTQRGDGLTGGAPRLTGSRSRQASNRLLGGYL